MITSEAQLGETVESVRVYQPNGDVITINRADLIQIELQGLAVAWKVGDRVHRAVGLPLEMISTQSRILKPA